MDWKNWFDNQLKSYLSMNEHEIEDASFEIPFPEMESPRFHSFHNPTQVGPDWPVLEKGAGWYLPLEAHRRIPRYLCAMTMFSDGNRVTGDHFEYWRCTGAFASMVSELPGMKIRQIPDSIKDAPEISSTFPGTSISLSEDIINDLCLLIQLSVLGEYATEVMIPEWSPGHQYLNPVVERLALHWAQLSATYGFPVFEGLLKQRRREPNDEDTYLHDAMKIWVEQYAKSSTMSTMVEIDRLHLINPNDEPEIVVRALDKLVTENERNSRDGVINANGGLMGDLRDRRNDTQHRNKIVRGVATIVTTLSCLVFWDSITEEDFKNLRRQIRFELERDDEWQHELLRKGKFLPESFYNSPPRQIRLLNQTRAGDQ